MHFLICYIVAKFDTIMWWNMAFIADKCNLTKRMWLKFSQLFSNYMEKIRGVWEYFFVSENDHHEPPRCFQNLEWWRGSIRFIDRPGYGHFHRNTLWTFIWGPAETRHIRHMPILGTELTSSFFLEADGGDWENWPTSQLLSCWRPTILHGCFKYPIIKLHCNYIESGYTFIKYWWCL